MEPDSPPGAMVPGESSTPKRHTTSHAPPTLGPSALPWSTTTVPPDTGPEAGDESDTTGGAWYEKVAAAENCCPLGATLNADVTVVLTVPAATGRREEVHCTEPSPYGWVPFTMSGCAGSTVIRRHLMSSPRDRAVPVTFTIVSPSLGPQLGLSDAAHVAKDAWGSAFWEEAGRAFWEEARRGAKG